MRQAVRESLQMLREPLLMLTAPCHDAAHSACACRGDRRSVLEQKDVIADYLGVGGYLDPEFLRIADRRSNRMTACAIRRLGPGPAHTQTANRRRNLETKYSYGSEKLRKLYALSHQV